MLFVCNPLERVSDQSEALNCRSKHLSPGTRLCQTITEADEPGLAYLSEPPACGELDSHLWSAAFQVPGVGSGCCSVQRHCPGVVPIRDRERACTGDLKSKKTLWHTLVSVGHDVKPSKAKTQPEEIHSYVVLMRIVYEWPVSPLSPAIPQHSDICREERSQYPPARVAVQLLSIPLTKTLLGVAHRFPQQLSVLPLQTMLRGDTTKRHTKGGILRCVKTVEPTLYGDTIGMAPELVNGDLVRPFIDYQVRCGVPEP